MTEKLSLKRFIEMTADYLCGYKLTQPDYDDTLLASCENGVKLSKDAPTSMLASVGTHVSLTSKGCYTSLVATGIYAKLATTANDVTMATTGHYSKLLSIGDRSRMATLGSGSQAASPRLMPRMTSSGYCSHLASTGDRAKIAAAGGETSVEATGRSPVVAVAGMGSRVKVGKGGVFCLPWGNPRTGYNLTVGKEGVNVKADTWYSVNRLTGEPKASQLQDTCR